MASPTEPAKWQLIAWQKKDEQFQRIPFEWRLRQLPDKHVTNLLDILRTCGILSEKELEITEKYDATALAEAIRKREISCVDVARAFCKRAAIAHQLTNCLAEILFNDALQRAKELDDHLSSGKPPLGPLHGVPVSLKDTFKIKGYDASIGIAALCFQPATSNSVLVTLLLKAGAVLYCKTNIPQTLMALDSHNNIFGRTLNPLNTSLTPGGSSGGEGALLALRGSILGIGTDVGGSIRIPAMCNGLFGLKPSCERIPYTGQEGGQKPAQSKLGIPASAGPLAHTARDVSLFFSTVASQNPWEHDPDVIPSPWPLQPSLPSSKRLRVGLVRRDGVIDPHPPILHLLDQVSTKLRRAGIEVCELDITPLFKHCQSLANALFGIEGGNNIFDLLESTGEPLSPWLQTRLRRKPALAQDQIRALHAKREELQMKFLQIWKSGAGEKGEDETEGEERNIDVLICPVAPHPVPEIDAWNGVSYTSSFVLLDYPAGVIPVREFTREDARGEISEARPVLGSWDKANRALWTNTNREVYIGSTLSIQVVAPKLEEKRLCEAMCLIDEVLKGGVAKL